MGDPTDDGSTYLIVFKMPIETTDPNGDSSEVSEVRRHDPGRVRS